MWADSHCHLPAEGSDAVVADAAAAGVGRLVCVGTDPATSAAAVGAAGRHPEVWATVGLHPHDAETGHSSLLGLLSPPDARVVGIGECGLDYHYDHAPRQRQREEFAAQVALAHRLGLTLVIHTRDAWDDTFAVLGAEGPPARTVFHCFTGGPGEVRRALDLGAWVSFSGIVSFARAEEVRDAARTCPADRLLVETDSPYLAPVPHRGEVNRPALVAVVGAAVAAARGEPVATVEDNTWEATAAAFGLPA